MKISLRVLKMFYEFLNIKITNKIIMNRILLKEASLTPAEIILMKSICFCNYLKYLSSTSSVKNRYFIQHNLDSANVSFYLLYNGMKSVTRVWNFLILLLVFQGLDKLFLSAYKLIILFIGWLWFNRPKPYTKV